MHKLKPEKPEHQPQQPPFGVFFKIVHGFLIGRAGMALSAFGDFLAPDPRLMGRTVKARPSSGAWKRTRKGR